MNKLSEDEADDLFKEADTDGNGHIEYKGWYLSKNNGECRSPIALAQ